MSSRLADQKLIEFPGTHGHTLAGRLESPPATPVAYALFAHCFTCGKDSVAAARISRALTEHGIAVLRFDFTGLGQSGGEFADTTFTSNVGDLIAAADHLRVHYAAPSLLIGHSLGGAAVLAAASRIPEVTAVATIGAPADPRHVLRFVDGHTAEIAATGSAWVDLGGRPFRVGNDLLRDLADQQQRGAINQLDAALLVMHSPVDRIVPVENAREIFDSAPHPKSFVALDGADHLLTARRDAEFAAGVIGAWASRYVTAPASIVHPSPRPADKWPEQGVVRVAENGHGPYGQAVKTSRHELTADEPEPIGADSGPSPYEYLLAALGACTSMTLRMYAERKQWSIGRISVELTHSRIHAEDCANCATQTRHVDHITRTISIQGTLTPAQHDSLLTIADRCPVHRTLHGSVAVTTTLATSLKSAA
ncbi:bifunctional alpha/beta hydrolase/OsmC family protein [Microbacterium sp. bgisy189]|uniref:bifunctional alpha/beta hydrolase/OsmC family protein n=1 Tax=Microbacterium sp. bgisy189 TaxID=3413798 RepID=UPI003EBB65B9